MKVIIILTLVFVFYYLPVHAQFPGWKKVQELGDIKVWHLISNTNVTGSLQIKKTKSKMDWSSKNWSEYLKSLEKEKSKVLSLFNISNWKGEKYNWKKKDGYYLLEIEGSYNNHTGTPIAFKEIHLFYPDKTIQVLHTRPIGIQNGERFSKEIIEHIFKII